MTHTNPANLRVSALVSRLLLRLAGACVVVMLGLGPHLAVAPVAAQGDPLECDEPVVDTSGEVDVDMVQLALQTVNPEATVVVRAFDRVPDADLMATIDEIVVECFGDETLGVRPDVVVLGLSVQDRVSDVLVGSRWGVAVSDPDRLRSDAMGARFSQGDYTGGFVAAIEEIAIGVDRQLELAESNSGEDDGNTSPVDDGQQNNGGPDGGRSPWAVGGGLAGLGACGGVFYLVNRQRRLAAARSGYERASVAPLNRLGMLRERDTRLTAQADVWSKTSHGRTLTELGTLVAACTAGRSSVDRSGALLTQTIPDGIANADSEAIGRAQARLAELSRALDTQGGSLDRLASFGAHLDHLRVALPTKAELLDEEIDEALAMAEQRTSQGWTTESQTSELNRIGSVIDGLDFNQLELDLLELSDRIEGVEAQLFATNHYLQSLPSRVNSLKKWNAGLEAAADLELERVEDLRRQMTRIAGAHATDSWHWAVDHPELAVEEIQVAEEMQDVAISEMISQQRFDDAGAQLDRAGLRLMVADQLLDQVDDLVVDLDQAMAEAPGIVDGCRQVLRDFSDYVGRHRGDLTRELVVAPDELAAAIDGLVSELGQTKPNFLRVAETGDRIGRQIDALLAEAEDQHLRMESLRRELRREVARADRALARARRSLGWELFKSGDGRSLDRLESALRRLPDDLQSAIAEAADIADDALRVQERIIARRRRGSVWVNTGGGDWRSGGGGWSVGGGSSGGGSFGGSAGRSFGGSSASGGRSFGGGRSTGSF